MSIFQFLFGNSKKQAITDYLAKGAIIVDVRSKEEFKQGHAKNSLNIPLQDFSKSVAKLKSNKKPVILVCRSGGRAGTALQELKAQNIDAVNGGSWTNI